MSFGLNHTRNLTIPLVNIVLLMLCLGVVSEAGEKGVPDDVIEYPWAIDVFVRGENGIFLHRIPALAVTTKGTILALCDARIKAGDDLPNNIDLALRRSFDMGKTWTPIQIIADFPGTEGAGDASLLVDRQTGRIWVFYAYGPEGIGSQTSQPGIGGPTLRLHLMHSDDDGASWSEATDLNPMVKDPAWKAVWSSPGSGFQARSGRLYFPLIQVFDVAHSRLIYSDDHGNSWKITAPMGRNTNESMCVELDDGRLMANMRGLIKQRTVSISNDQGRSWEPMYDYENLIGPQCQASLIRYSSLSNGDDKNRLLFSNPASTKRENMTVRMSYDEGKSWPVSKIIYTGLAAYSSLAVLPDGSIGMLYEHGSQHDTDQLTFVRFTVEWLTDGKDKVFKISEAELSALPVKGPYFPCDERIIEDRWKVERFVVELQRYAANPIMVKDQHIEGKVGPMSGGTVLLDPKDQLYKMWYGVFDLHAYNNKLPFSYNMCYAESGDGIEWQKPVLGLFDNRGSISPQNNAIKLGREKTGGIDVEFNPGAKSPQERFVAIHNDSGGVFVSYSGDGKTFDCAFDHPAVWYHSDTHNNFVYDEVKERWLMYVRPRAFAGNDMRHVGRRRVAVKESADLINWSHERTVLVPEENDPDYFYGMTVFRRGDLFFGQLQMYETVFHHLYQELVWSGDGIYWHRLPQSAQRICLNIGPENAWDGGMVSLFEKPVLVNNEMRFYYGGNDKAHDAFGTGCIGLATTKRDRLIGVQSIPDTLGRVLTRPIPVKGDLFINAHANGEIRVEIRSAVRDEPLAGWTANDCIPFSGDELDATIRWGDKSLKDLRGKLVRLRFQLKEATLFSFDIR